MAIVHVVLQKQNDPADTATADEWAKRGNAMLGKIPGMTAITCGPCIEGSRHRTEGYTHMLYCVFDDEKALRGYADHPVHLELIGFGKGKFSDKIVFDLEVPSA